MYAIAGLCDVQGRWVAKRRNVSTNQVKLDKEVRFATPSMVLEYELNKPSLVRVVCLERRFRKREIGYVTLDLSHYTASDRVDRWFKLVEGEGDKKDQRKGEVRLRIRFQAEPPFDEREESESAPKKQRAEEQPLSFGRSLTVASSPAETFEQGEPHAWLLAELERGAAGGDRRRGTVSVRLRCVSPADDMAALSVVCGEHIAMPALGECCHFPVVYEPEVCRIAIRFSSYSSHIPQSSYVKLFVFLHVLSEAPLASCTLVFEDASFLSEWFPLYPRGHSQYVKLSPSHTRSLRPVAPLPSSAPPDGLLADTAHTAVLGSQFYSVPPRERAEDKEERHSLRQGLALVTAVLLLAALVCA